MMSLSKKKQLQELAKVRARELRRNETAAEKHFWSRVRNRQFEGQKFYRQYQFVVDKNGSETFFVVDFYCHEHRLVIELDGSIHDMQRREDSEREALLSSQGLRILRYSNEAVLRYIENVLDDIRRYFNESEQ